MASLTRRGKLALFVISQALLLQIQTLPLQAESILSDQKNEHTEQNLSSSGQTAGKEGIATYYAKKYTGRRTASGSRYNPQKLTAAHQSLPLGKKVKVCVIASGEKVKEAEDAGADFAGGEDLVAKIQGGWMEFDAVVSTPDMMKSVGKLGRVLGPRGLMPNPKTGTVTFEIGKAVAEIKSGKVEFRVDKNGIIHAPVGKLSFGKDQLVQNAKSLIEAVVRAKPAAAKGRYLKSVTLSSTMGPGIKLDVGQLEAK